MLINLEFNSIKELEDFIARFNAGQGKVSALPASTGKADGPKDESSKPAAVKTDTPKDVSTPKAPAAPKADPKQPEGELSYTDDIAPRVLKLGEVKGRDAAIAMLESFGVKKAPQLEVSQYPDFVKAVDAKLAEE